MEWTRPLSFVLTAIVAVLAVVATAEISRTTLADSEYAVAAAVTLLLVVGAVIGMAVVGARSKQWVENPDSYW